MTMMEPRDKELTDYLRCVFLKPTLMYHMLPWIDTRTPQLENEFVQQQKSAVHANYKVQEVF